MNWAWLYFLGDAVLAVVLCGIAAWIGRRW
jgi:hypothetical protein